MANVHKGLLKWIKYSCVPQLPTRFPKNLVARRPVASLSNRETSYHGLKAGTASGMIHTRGSDFERPVDFTSTVIVVELEDPVNQLSAPLTLKQHAATVVWNGYYCICDRPAHLTAVHTVADGDTCRC